MIHLATVQKIDDKIRLNILDALLKKRSVTPNIRQIQKYTGYHKATIKSSIDFLSKEGILSGFGPKVNFRKFGYKLESIVMMQTDLMEKATLKNFLDEAEKDPNLYRISSVVGSGNWNLMARYIYKDIESYHNGMQNKYYEKIPNIHNLIRDKTVFYGTDPLYKNVSRTKSIIEAIRKEKGYE